MDQKNKIKIFRERFNGRQDVFGRKWTAKSKEGDIRSGYTPVCENAWKDFCHIKLKDGITCSECVNKIYVPVTDESVWSHITGDDEHTFYLLLEDGTINYGGIDFDCKEGKEDSGYKWDDIDKFCSMLDEWAIPYGISRSTTMGYHIYFFFDQDRCQANIFRSLMMEIFDRVGFIKDARRALRTIPEIFPKQSWAGNNGVGNPLKPPMIETRWKYERNGFLNRDGSFIPEDKQWEFLDNIPRINQKTLEDLILKFNVRILEEPRPTGSSISRSNNQGINNKKVWQPPLTGSIDKLLDGCQALRRIRDLCLEGKTPSHLEGFALWHACMATADGTKWFLQNVPGWGKTDQDIKQLEYSTAKNYSPHTCLKLQQDGICTKGTQCFEKQPPKGYVGGNYVVLKEVPKDQWPEPSPIRYAYGKGEDFLLKLIKEADELSYEDEIDVKKDKVSKLLYRARMFDAQQREQLEKHIKKLKLIPASQLSSIISEQNSTKKKEIDEIAESRSDIIYVNDLAFQKMPFGYALLKRDKNRDFMPKPLCSFDLLIEEQRVYLENNEIMKSSYIGKCITRETRQSFEIPIKDWHDTTKFNEYFGQKLGEHYLIQRNDIELVRIAAIAFSSRARIDKKSYNMTQGWYKSTYIMPSVIVDKEGVRFNIDQHIDLSHKQVASSLDFKILSEETFKETLIHLRKDFLFAWPFEWTSFAISHTLMAGLMNMLEIRKKPSLFFEGLTGSGKTELMQTVAYFWGDFRRITNLSSTGLGIQDTAYDFKDALLVVDDYKGATNTEKQALEKSIQYSYDEGSVRVKLKRDGSQDAAKDSRALFMFTGEEFLSSDSAKVSRCILIDVDKRDMSETKEAYGRCIKMRDNYAGITPRFLHWCLNQDLEVVKERMRNIEDELYAITTGQTNAQRIAYNLSRSRIVFELFCQFLIYHGVTDENDVEELLSRHWKEILRVNEVMTYKCGESQNGNVFITILRQLILTKELSIEGLDGFNHEYKKIIGFARRTELGNTAVFLYPDITYKLVMEYGKASMSLSGAKTAITRQLVSTGLIMNKEGARSTVRINNEEKQIRMWRVDMEKLGINLASKDDGGKVGAML